MKFITRTLRLMQIYGILMRYNLDVLLFRRGFLPLRCLVFLNPYHWLGNRHLTRAERVRLALIALGPIFVKAGQILSTRRDIIPEDICQELTKLQDRVPPFSSKKARALVEKSLNCSIDTAFSEFASEPLASASIAQVHAARLISGESVVVKILRPKIHGYIHRDVDVLRFLAKLVARTAPNAQYLKPKQLIEEVAQTLHDELDLTREGANASQLKRNFAHSTLLHVPTIYWQYSQHHILVMERIYGVPIHDIARLHQLGVDMHKLATRGIELFFTQVFRDSFFHADLHPGNIFVSVTDPLNPTYILVDFGIVGSLNQTDQRYLAENMLALFNRDYQRSAELHVACGWLPPDTRIDQFESAMRAVCEPMFEQPLKNVSFGKLLLRLFQLAQHFRMNVQPQLILLQKTLLSIESLSRQLAPDLDIWQVASPEIKKWLKRHVGPRAFLRRVRENLPLWSEQLPAIPSLMYEVLKETKYQQETARFNHMNLPKKSSNRPIKLTYFLLGILASSIGYFLTVLH